MLDYGYTELPALAVALHRLKRARVQELWLRSAMWTWCAVAFFWLLPLGSWSATALPLGAAVLSGAGLAACCALLFLLHHLTGRMASVQAAIAEAELTTQR